MGKFAEYRNNKKKKEEGNTSSSGSFTKFRLENQIGFDTFESDLKSMGETIGSIYGGWQTQETMSNTRGAVEAMRSRLDAYQTYQKKYGGTDLSEVASGYKSIIDDWDNLTSAYGHYQNADAYDKAMKKSKLDKDFAGLTYDEVQAKKKEYGFGTEEYAYLNNYTNYSSSSDFEKALNSATSKKVKDKLTEAKNIYDLDHVGDKWLDVAKNDDFADTSKYEKGNSELYEYINNVNGARENILYAHDKIQAGSPIYTPSKYTEMGLDAMTDEEIGIYNTLYAQDKVNGTNTADEYLSDIEKVLTKRISDKQSESIKNSADNSALESALLSIASPIMNIGGGIYSGIDSISNLIKGEESNPYSIYHSLPNMSNDISTEVGENIAESTQGMDILGVNVPSFLYNTGMSIADSALGAFSLGKAYTPLMGMSAYQQTAKELTEAGASKDEIMITSLVSGLAEAGFEYAGIDNLFKTKGSDSIKAVLTNTLKQMGAEAGEEVGTEIVNIIADTWIRNNSEYKQMYEELIARGFSEQETSLQIAKDIGGRVAQAGIGGALSGGVMGGVFSTVQHHDLKSTGAELRANDRTQDVMSMFTPEEAETYKLYSEYAGKGVTADNISDAQLGNLYETKASSAYDTYASRKSTAEQKKGAIRTLDALSTYRSTPNTKLKATGEKVDIKGVKEVDGDTVLVTNSGEVSAKDVSLSSNHSELLSLAENMSEEKANLFIEQYDGTSNVEAYKDSFEMAYAYGETGFGADSVLKNRGVLTEAQASEIYKRAITNKVAVQQKAIDDINAKYGKAVTVAGKFNDSIIDYNSTNADGSKVNWNSLTSKQRDAITFAKGFSEATGVNIKFIKSKVEDGKRVGKNGSYKPETNSIEIDVYAGVIDASALNDSIIPTISHEVTHWMKAKAPAMYSKMREHIMETLAMDGKLTSEERVAQEMERIKKNHTDVKVTEEMAIDEIMARACEDMLSNSDTARKMLNRMSKKEQNSFISKVKETFDNIMKWVNELLSQYKSTSKEAEVLRQYKDRLKQLSKMWDKALAEAVQTNQSMQNEGILGEDAINRATQKVGVNVDLETESAYPSEQLSERTWSESEYVQNKEVAVKALVKAIGVTEADAERYINNINSIAKMIADDRARLDYEPNMDEYASVLKTNKEYKWTVDMSTLCAKRLLFTGTFDAIQKALPNTAFNSDDIVALRSMMLSRGYEVACGICYVESTRRELGTITADFIERYKLSQKTGKPITRVNSEGKVVELKKTQDQMTTTVDKSTDRYIADKDYTPTLAELNTTDIDKVKVEHPLVYEAYLSFMNARGQAKPKLLETRAEYKGEILKHFNKSAVNARNKAGGLRVQSFSDFEIAHLIDMMQITLDMSRVSLMSQAYTKVPAFAEVFGDTGIKINLSLIAKDSGLDENGNLIFDDVEGINHEEAFRLRDKYSKNVGTILVGKSDEHIIKAMADPRIDFIIPFHKSFWKESLYDALGLVGYDDYTETQNEKPLDKERKIKNFKPSEYWDYSKTGEENAQVYLQMCKEDGRIPKFPQFQGYEGYWKLLIDFKMYDNDGVGSPQTAVQPNFNMEGAMDILKSYEGGHRSFPVADDVVSDFVKEYKQNHPQEQYADREVTPLTDEDYKNAKKHFGTTNNFNVAGYMLKDGYMLDFSGKHWGDTTSRFRQVDHRDIQEVIPDSNNGFDSMVNMISNGNIRLMPEDGGINLAIAPTKNQRIVLRRYIEFFKGKCVVDIDAVGGDTIQSFTYDRGTSADRILRDIDNYFRGGRQSNLMRFHTMYSDRGYMDAVNRGDMETVQKMVDEFANKVMADSKLRTPDGKLRVVYHGTNTGDFTVFNPDYIGMSSGDDGFFGMGFYFAYSKGEAEYYGAKRIIPAYLDIKNPFNFRKEFYEYKGERAEYGNAPDAVALINFADKFPEIAKDITIDVGKKGSEYLDTIPLSEFTKAFKDVIDNKKFDFSELTNSYGEKEILATADEKMVEYEYGGEKHSFKDYGFQKRWLEKPSHLDVAYQYLSTVVYDYVDMTRFTNVILDNNREFTSTLKEMGYDGVIQSEHGDEAVAFDSSQIKSADAVTYDDKGNVIPLSKRFDASNEDIRYSDRETNSWLDATSIDDILADILENHSIEELIDDEMFLDEDYSDELSVEDAPKKVRAKRRVDVVNKRLKEIGLSFNGTKSLAWTDERIEKYLSDGYYGSSNPKYAQAYIAYITPQQFLNLTVGGKNSTLDIIENESAEYGDVDIEKLGNSSPMFLEIKEGRVWSQVTGHEGRHRMYLLGKAGFEKVPVLLFDYRTKYDKTAKAEMKLIAQKFNRDVLVSKSRNVALEDVIPFSQGNRDLIIEKFGSGNKDADIRFSDRDNVSVYEAMGEAERLANDNLRLKADIDKLKSTISDKDVEVRRFRSLADYLNKLAGSKVDRETLGDSIKEIYNYIQTTDNLEWVDVVAKTYDVANTMLNKSMGVPTNYFKEVMANIRKEKVSLSPEQIAEAEKLYGNYSNFHKAMFGRINIVKEGTSLDDAWSEWSKKYPAIFKANLDHTEQIQTLVDITDALKATSSLMGEYEREEAIRHLSTEIYNQLWNIASDSSKATKEARASHRELMQNMRKEYEERQKEKTLHPTGETALKYEKLLRKMKEKEKREIKKAKELGKEKMGDYKDRVARKQKIERIKKNSKLLMEYLEKNTKNKHITDDLKGPVRDLLVSIDYATRNGGIDALEQKEALAKVEQNVHDARKKVDLRANLTALQMSASEDEMLQRAGVDFSSDIEAITESLRKLDLKTDTVFVLKDMSLEDVTRLDRIIRTLKAVITRANYYGTLRRKITISASAHELFDLFDSLGEAKEGKLDGVKDFFDYDNVTPVWFFDRLGPVGKDLFQAFVRGQSRQAFNIVKAKEFSDSLCSDDKKHKWDTDLIEFEVIDAKKTRDITKPVTKKVYTTTSRLMTLYLHDKREQSQGHLYKGGGGRFTTFEHKGKTYGEDVNGVVLTPQLVKQMLTKLDPEAKEVADKISVYLNTVCKNLGNEVTRDLYDVELFLEPKYIPIEVIQESVSRKMDKSAPSITALLNKGFTKETKPNAKNQIVLDSIFDVFAKHTAEMITYNAYAREVYDAVRLFEYNENRQTYVLDDEEGQTVSDNIQIAMRGALGSGAVKYFRNFLEDINGTQQAGRGNGLLNKAFSNSKLANVAWNMNVAILQPLALCRAMISIHPKYLAKGLFGIRSGMKSAMEHSGTAIYKSLGYYDTDISLPFAEQIKGDKTFGDKMKEWSMWGAGFMDKVTWGALWKACEHKVLAENKGLTRNSDGFYDKVVEVFDETVYRTQVMDSVLSRSQIMRDKNLIKKGLTSFMAEPLLSYNTVYGVFSEWNQYSRQGHSVAECSKKCGKKLAVSIGVYCISSLAEAGVRTLTSAMRGAGDDEEKDENVFLEELLSALNPLSKIPVAREIVSAMQGYGVSKIPALNTIEAFVNAYKTIGKIIIDGEEVSYKKVYKLLNAVSSASGHGISNAYRDIVAIWNSTIGQMYPSLIIKTDE